MADPAAAPVIANDDACSSLASQIIYDAPADGIYRVLVGTFATVLGGTYTIAYATRVPTPAASIATVSSVKVGNGFLGLPFTNGPPHPDLCEVYLDNPWCNAAHDPFTNTLYVCGAYGWTQLTLNPVP